MHNPNTWPPRVPFIQVSMEREQWLSEAENAEKGSAPRTAQAIVQESISLGVEEEASLTHSLIFPACHTPLFPFVT